MNARGPRPPDTHQLRVIDHEALTEVLEQIAKHAGSHRKAAAALGIEQSTFTRLLKGAKARTQRRIQAGTYHRILEALSKKDFGLVKKAEWGLDALEWLEFQDRFRDSVLSWEGRQIRAGYESWLDRELDRLRPRVDPIRRQLQDSKHCRLLERFVEKLRRSDEPSRGKRIELALYRALEPLANATPTYGVERSWLELDSTGELSAFLKASLRREEIMLNREADHERLATREPPPELYADLAPPLYETWEVQELLAKGKPYRRVLRKLRKDAR